MRPLFRNKYKIGSKRKFGYDYSLPGKYFITICTKNRIKYFGKIENRKMVLSEIGQVLQTEWLKTPLVRPDMNITLDEFVVMPDHFHAIIIIGKNQYNQNHDNRDTQTMHCGSTFSPQIKNLASIIRGVKSAVTQYAKKMKIDFEWQPRFHDHIIRNHTESERIRNYIRRNPENWKNR
jgi:REP element-mobilizing transposase RayT